VEVELSPEQKRLYKSMERDFIAFLEDSDKAIVAQLAITKTLRMRQILSGFIKTDDDKITLLKRTPREAALEELLEEITGEHKVLVWSVFKAEYEIIRKVCKRLKLPFVEAHGGISNKAKYEAVEAFNTDPKVRVFIGHPGALGIGINLVASSYSIYYSRDYSLEQRDQSQARNYRGGSEQHESITHIDIVAKETIDEVILKSLENKTNIKSLENKTNIAEEILAWKKSQ
jgi:SNF2 family DNA or RNA helicase